MKKLVLALVIGVTAGMSGITQARVTKELPYPTGTPDANQIMDQVYFVNHFYAFNNYSISKKGRKVTVLMTGVPGKRPTTITLSRFLNNGYDAGNSVNAKDLAIFHSGKLKGTGMLITDFAAADKSQSYAVWLPSLRKIRRFAEPAHDDSWGGSDFTFGDVTLRKPENETHELQGTETFNDCLGKMDVPKQFRNKFMKNLPDASCTPKGRSVYVVKSTTKFPNWWYDYRLSYVDTKTFADYRTEYFKDGKQVKVIDRDWVAIGDGSDPRMQSWGYWYGKTIATGHETWAVIPPEVVKVNNKKLKASKWTEKTLRKIKR